MTHLEIVKLVLQIAHVGISLLILWEFKVANEKK
jgi:hypothetical protein